MEVVIAIGLCTFVMLTLFALLSVGMLTLQNASRQITQTEIFDRLWSQFNTTPFYLLQNQYAYSGVTVSPVFATPSSAVYFYYDEDGWDITSTSNAAATAVYTARCTLVNSKTDSNLETTVPIVDGGSATTGTGPSLTFIQVQIGFHFNAANLQPGKTDPRVATRTFLIAKRDTWDGS